MIGATWDTTLQTTDYSATGDTAYQYPGSMNVMTNIPQVAREKTLYRSEETESRGEAGNVE